MMKLNLYLVFTIAFLLPSGAVAKQSKGPPTGDAVQAPNFKGINVCMHVLPPAGAEAGSSAGVTIRLTTILGDPATKRSRDASYEIAAAGIGEINLRERLDESGACGQRPLNRFAWVNVGSQRAEAEFCLAARDRKHANVLVTAQARSDSARLTQTKAMLVGLAACRMKTFPSEFDPDDHYFDEEILHLGPYILATTR